MAADETPKDPELPQDARLDSLEQRLRHAQDQEALRDRRQQGDPSYRIGQQVLGHLVGAPFAGGFLGWLIDKWFGTLPIFMLLFLFVGFGVGIRNVIRISKTSSGPGPGAS
ncbi:MAG: AtpZ/AtpI family protein [Pseudomonadota bacterium]|nr:AtpZ/AtpI family protein [Pseudomonadota bacterium]